MFGFSENIKLATSSLRSISSKINKKRLFLLALISIFIGSISVVFPLLCIKLIIVLILVVLTYLYYQESFFVFSILLLSLGDYFGSYAINLGGFKFYGADYFIVILIIVIIRKLEINELKIHSPITLALILYILYGGANLLCGIFYQNHEINVAVGEFRRFFYYPLAFFLGLNVIKEKRSLIKFEKLITLVPFIIMVPALFRIYTNISWAPEIHNRPGDFRAMAYYDTISLIFVFSFIALLSIEKKKLSPFRSIILLLTPYLIVISKFRLSWGLLILVSMLIFFYGLRKKSRKINLLPYFLVFLLLSSSLLMVKTTGGEYYKIVKKRVTERILQFKLQDKYRFDAWISALDKFHSSPFIGVGLGVDTTYWTQNSEGKWIQVSHTIHNAFIEILYQTGIIGAFLFLFIIFKHGYYVWKNLKRVASIQKPITISLFILFLCGFIQSLFQPYLNHPGSSVFFFAAMGLSLRLIVYFKKT